MSIVEKALNERDKAEHIGHPHDRPEVENLYIRQVGCWKKSHVFRPAERDDVGITIAATRFTVTPGSMVRIHVTSLPYLEPADARAMAEALLLAAAAAEAENSKVEGGS